MLSFAKNRDQPRNRQVCLTTPNFDSVELPLPAYRNPFANA